MLITLMLIILRGIPYLSKKGGLLHKSGLRRSHLLLLPLIALLGCVQVTPTLEPSPAPSPTVGSAVPIATPTPTPTAIAILESLPTPTAALEPSSSPMPTPSVGKQALLPIFVASLLPIPPERDLLKLAQELRLKSQEPIPGVVPGEYTPLQEGYQEPFNVADLLSFSVRKTNATLKVVSEHAYWFVEEGLDIATEDLRQAAETFEERIYSTVVSFFGDIWNPGADNDPHLVILHARFQGAAGYYSSADEYPVEVHPNSNQREIIYINGETLKVGTPSYFGTLAHELQHAVHWRADPSEEGWVNEGLSEVAKELAGYHAYFTQSFRSNPQTQLNYWPNDPRLSPAHYGGSSLFFIYLAQHYGGYQNLKLLLNGPEDGIEAVNAYLTRLGFAKTFQDVFKDWVVANTINAPEGLYGYPDRKVPILNSRIMVADGQRTGDLSQFGTHYLNLRFKEGDVLISFEGNETIPLIPVQAHSGDYCWWSNRGDAINSTLTRQFDLSSLDQATLEYWVWYELEAPWDYAYVEVSTDAGLTWDILKGTRTSQINPVGNNFGHGLTGSSGGWVKERVDLTPYAGKRVLLRFQYITDDAVHLRGLCIDDVSIAELAYFHDAEDDGGWEAQGFVRIDNRLPQEFFVQVIEQGEDTRVRQMVLDQNRKGEMLVEGFGSRVKDAIVVISPVTPVTTELANYTLTVRMAGE